MSDFKNTPGSMSSVLKTDIDLKQKLLFKKYEFMYSIKMEDLTYFHNPDSGISDGEYKYVHVDHPHLFFVWNEDWDGYSWWSVELVK